MNPFFVTVVLAPIITTLIVASYFEFYASHMAPINVDYVRYNLKGMTLAPLDQYENACRAVKQINVQTQCVKLSPEVIDLFVDEKCKNDISRLPWYRNAVANGRKDASLFSAAYKEICNTPILMRYQGRIVIGAPKFIVENYRKE